VVNAKGRLLYANRAGEIMFASGGGLTISNGVLRAVDTNGTHALHKLIGAAGAGDADQRKGGEMALARTGGRRPLSITVVPARSPGISLFQSEPSVLVCAIDPGANVVVPEQRLRDLFGLSRAEVRLALQLLNGHDAKTAAKRLGLSYNTVRAHLVRMMAKTGANRQAELIRIMLSAS
jgi:DNA-binding CsgD family transcriptional regulator